MIADAIALIGIILATLFPTDHAGAAGAECRQVGTHTVCQWVQR